MLSQATEIYGVSGIPHIIVFCSRRTILARDLRGNGTSCKKVDELLAKITPYKGDIISL